ncbi:MAG: hypothetical protein ABSH45_08460 [Bryobacteraceae bacterium]
MMKAGVVGPQFFKDFKGPFPQIEIMPTGAVNWAAAAEFIKAGAWGIRGRMIGRTG